MLPYIMRVITTICYDKQQNSFLNCSNKGTYHILYNKHAQFQFYKIDTCSSFREILTNEQHYHIERQQQIQVLAAFVFQVANHHQIFFLKGGQQLFEWYEIL